MQNPTRLQSCLDFAEKLQQQVHEEKIDTFSAFYQLKGYVMGQAAMEGDCAVRHEEDLSLFEGWPTCD